MVARQTLTRIVPVALLLIGVALGMTACAPAPDVYTIPPNATGFLIPLADTSAQAKFQSEAYLKDKQVAAHQVQIQYHGVSNNSIGSNYYPDDLLVLVDRSAVTRNWTSNAASGTSHADQAFAASSADGISFKLDSSCTAQIYERDAAKYLYNFSGSLKGGAGGNPSLINVDTLPVVMDNNVWGAMQDNLTVLFNALAYDQVRQQSAALFREAVQAVTTAFEAKGVTITACGLQGGPKPDDPQVAAAYNRAQAGQGASLSAAAQATAQAITNQRDVAQAQAQATAQSYTNQVRLDYLHQQGELAAKYPGLAALTQAQRWNGQPPQVVGGSGNSGWLYPGLLPQPTVAAGK